MSAESIKKTGFDTEYVILENIYDSHGKQAPLRQRDLANIAGASLGMTNSIIKRLAKKGWITIKKLNSRNIRYAVTLEGMNEIIHRSYRYFKRTIRNVVFYKEVLEDLILNAKRKKISKVVLVGVSDLDFIVEHASRHWGLSFSRIADTDKSSKAAPDTLKIYAESIAETGVNPKAGTAENTFYLSRLIMKQAAGLDSGV